MGGAARLVAAAMVMAPLPASAFDVAGIAEDIALYVSTGEFCKLPSIAEVNEIGAVLMALDAKQFEAGALRGITMFRGLETNGRDKVCRAAVIARPKIEADMRQMAASIKSLKSRR